MVPTVGISGKKETSPALSDFKVVLKSEQGKQLIETIFPLIDKEDIIQDSYFQYHHSNLVKKSFITDHL